MRSTDDIGVTGVDRSSRSDARLVMLATLDTPFDPKARELAFDSALESGQRLLVVNVSAVQILPHSLMLGYAYLETEELTTALRAAAELAASFNVPVELMRIASPHAADALVELVEERRPSLVVLGPDTNRVRGRLYRRAARKLRESATCLVWLAAD
jgi:nucleotide-binding universal stress UspA family protein